MKKPSSLLTAAALTVGLSPAAAGAEPVRAHTFNVGDNQATVSIRQGEPFNAVTNCVQDLAPNKDKAGIPTRMQTLFPVKPHASATADMKFDVKTASGQHQVSSATGLNSTGPLRPTIMQQLAVQQSLHALGYDKQAQGFTIQHDDERGLRCSGL